MEEIPENGNLKLPILKYTGVAYFEKKNFFVLFHIANRQY